MRRLLASRLPGCREEVIQPNPKRNMARLYQVTQRAEKQRSRENVCKLEGSKLIENIFISDTYTVGSRHSVESSRVVHFPWPSISFLRCTT